MDSKKVIEKLIKIAENQQKIIQKLAQAAGNDPMEGTLPAYTGQRYNLAPSSAPAPAAPKPVNPLLTPLGNKLTDAEWDALLKQRFGLTSKEMSDAAKLYETSKGQQGYQFTDPAVMPGAVANPQHGQQATSNAPGTQGGPPNVGKPKLTPTEQEYVDMLKKKNQ